MSSGTIPIVILGGSDRQPAALPRQGRDKHPLSGYKGARLRYRGRPLITTIVERLDACEVFAPIFIAGPERVYRPIRGLAEVIDTDGTFGENIRAATETVRFALPGHPIGFITCDILPETDTLRQLMAIYAGAAPYDLWFPLVRVPKDARRLGASAWKPRYRIRPDAGQPAEEVLPGHLVVADPAAMRLEFIYRLFQLGYKTRNRPMSHRRRVMVRGILAELLYQDLLHILGLRLPTLTWNVLGSGLPTARKLKEGTATRTRIENTLRRIFVRAQHRRRYRDRRISLPFVDALSLAIDVDTEEEARAIGADLSENSA